LKHKLATLIALALIILVGAGVLYGESRHKSGSATPQQKIAALKELRHTGVITEQEYESQVQALQASRPQDSSESDDAKGSGDSQQKIDALKDLRDTGVIRQPRPGRCG